MNHRGCLRNAEVVVDLNGWPILNVISATATNTGVGHNVAPTDATASNMHTTSTNHGPHSTNTANKLDPRFDSDMDHRGTTTSSTNAGPHTSNFANKLDPRVDSDMDHRANPTSAAGMQGAGAGGLGGAGSTNAGPHASNLGNKLDPRVDSDMDRTTGPTYR
jgi:hypothetical protein